MIRNLLNTFMNRKIVKTDLDISGLNGAAFKTYLDMYDVIRFDNTIQRYKRAELLNALRESLIKHQPNDKK